MPGFTTESKISVRADFNAHKRYALKCLFSPDMTLVNITSSKKKKKKKKD